MVSGMPKFKICTNIHLLLKDEWKVCVQGSRSQTALLHSSTHHCLMSTSWNWSPMSRNKCKSHLVCIAACAFTKHVYQCTKRSVQMMCDVTANETYLRSRPLYRNLCTTSCYITALVFQVTWQAKVCNLEYKRLWLMHMCLEWLPWQCNRWQWTIVGLTAAVDQLLYFIGIIIIHHKLLPTTEPC